MPARLPDDVIYRVQLRIECGESSTAIHEATKVSMSRRDEGATSQTRQLVTLAKFGLDSPKT